MHPDDQCTAFSMLIDDKGMSIEDVATRFGITPAVVRQLLKLANIAPALRSLYRKGSMTLEHMIALAISDDRAAQQQGMGQPAGMEPQALLKQTLTLTHDILPATDKLAVHRRRNLRRSR